MGIICFTEEGDFIVGSEIRYGKLMCQEPSYGIYWEF